MAELAAEMSSGKTTEDEFRKRLSNAEDSRRRRSIEANDGASAVLELEAKLAAVSAELEKERVEKDELHEQLLVEQEARSAEVNASTVLYV